MIEGIKSILVSITDEGREEETFALSYGLSLAREANAHLTVQAAASAYNIPYSLLSDFARNLVSAENRRIATLAKLFADRARQEADFAGIVCTIESPQLHFRDLAQRFLGYARVHDLSILDAGTNPIGANRELIETALFESGRPALIVPSGREKFSGRHIIIAWDGSASATRAVAGAMPLLRAAEAIEIVSVVGEKDLSKSIPGTDLAPCLSRHGIDVTVANTNLGTSTSVAEAIYQEVSNFGADIIVAGAYRHSRLREFLLGGVTQDLLKDSRTTLFMCH